MAHKILVVGAGAVGLTAAVELTRAGHEVEIIERHGEIVPLSRAIGVNARTLELFEPSGFSETLVNAGRKLKQAHIHVNGKTKVNINFKNLKHKTQYILSLPQNITEALLEKELHRLGCQVSRETELVNFDQTDQQVTATVKDHQGERQIVCDYLLGADGAHSSIRKLAGLGFSGESCPEVWHLADVEMHWSYGDKDVQAFLESNGILYVVFPIGTDRFRIISNHTDYFNLLPKDSEIKKIHWQSDFKISSRIVDSYQKGRVFVMGDAAHIHSPVGGRGMNLGIEDAFTFVKLLGENQLQDYTKLRRAVGLHVLKTTDVAFRELKTRNPAKIFFRNHFVLPWLNWSKIQSKMLWDMAGLH